MSNVGYILPNKRTLFIIVEVTGCKNIFNEVTGTETWVGICSRENKRTGIEDAPLLLTITSKIY